MSDSSVDERLAKVPAITLGFWALKILATTLGETGGDAVSMSMNLGYLVGTAIFGALFIVSVTAQIRGHAFRPWLYWATIVASTTVGTTLADFVTRSIGLGYAMGSTLLLALLVASLWTWHRTQGSIAVASIANARSEAFYWITITFSQTLGTALGDWVADSAALGYVGGIVIFGSLLAVVVALYFWTRLSRTALFWSAFILTRPFGALVGDLLDKPADEGGLELSRYSASMVLMVAMAVCLLVFQQRPARVAH